MQLPVVAAHVNDSRALISLLTQVPVTAVDMVLCAIEHDLWLGLDAGHGPADARHAGGGDRAAAGSDSTGGETADKPCVCDVHHVPERWGFHGAATGGRGDHTLWRLDLAHGHGGGVSVLGLTAGGALPAAAERRKSGGGGGGGNSILPSGIAGGTR